MMNKYIKTVSELIENKQVRTEIITELEGHLLDKIDFYTEIGYSAEEAERRACEEMGSAEETAVPLNKLHRKLKYEMLFNIISVLIIAALGYFSICFTSALTGVHYIYKDYISLFIFIAYSALLIIAHKRCKQIIPFAIMISFIIQLVLSISQLVNVFNWSSNVLNLFKPMANMLIKLCVSGFGGYIDSIFAYGYVNTSCATNVVYQTVSIILLLILIVWTILVYIIIYNESRLKNTRKQKRIIKITKKFVCFLVLINILFMSVGTAISYSEIDKTIEKNRSDHYDMIDYVINADISLDYVAQLGELKKSGFEMTTEVGDIYYEAATCNLYVCRRDSNIIKLYVMEDGSGRYSLSYLSNAPYTLIDEFVMCSAEDYVLLANQIPGTTFEDFMITGLAYKSYELSRDNFSNKEDRIYIDFRFRDKDLSYAYAAFSDGYLIENTISDNYMETADERRKIIEYIINNSRIKPYDKSAAQCEWLIKDLENKDFNLEHKENDGNIAVYESKSDFTAFTVKCDYENNDYSLHYKAEDIENKFLPSNVHMYFDDYDFSADMIGLTIQGFYENYNAYWSKAAEVYSRFEYKDGDCIPIIKFAFAVKNENNDSGLQYTVLQFTDGELNAVSAISIYNDLPSVSVYDDLTEGDLYG